MAKWIELKRLARGPSGRTLLTGVAIIAVNLGTGVITARGLGVSGRGNYALCLLIPSTMAYLLDLGMPLGVTFNAAQGGTYAEAMQKRLPASGALIGVVVALVTAPLTLLYVNARIPDFAIVALLYTLSYVPVNIVTRFLLADAQGRQDFKTFNRVRIATPLLYFVLVAGLLATNKLTVGSCLLATLGGNLGALFFLAPALKHWAAPKVADLRGWTSFGLRGHLGNLTPVDAMQLDLVLVGALLGSFDAGIYAVSATAAMFIRGQGAALGMVAFPRIASAAKADRRGLVKRTILVAASIHIILAALCFILAPYAVKILYGNEYRAAVPIMRILIVGAVAAGIRQVTSDILRGMNRPGATSVNELVTWVLGIPLVLLLLNYDGLNGVAWGVSLAYLFALCLMFATLFRTLRAYDKQMLGSHREQEPVTGG